MVQLTDPTGSDFVHIHLIYAFVDIRSLIKDDVKLHNGIKKAALKHNVDQFIITRLPSGSASPRSPSPVGKSSLMERSGSSLSSPAKALNGSEVGIIM